MDFGGVTGAVRRVLQLKSEQVCENPPCPVKVSVNWDVMSICWRTLYAYSARGRKHLEISPALPSAYRSCHSSRLTDLITFFAYDQEPRMGELSGKCFLYANHQVILTPSACQPAEDDLERDLGQNLVHVLDLNREQDQDRDRNRQRHIEDEEINSTSTPAEPRAKASDMNYTLVPHVKHVKPLVADIVTALVTMVFNWPQPALGQRDESWIYGYDPKIKQQSTVIYLPIRASEQPTFTLGIPRTRCSCNAQVECINFIEIEHKHAGSLRNMRPRTLTHDRSPPPLAQYCENVPETKFAPFFAGQKTDTDRGTPRNS
ncbi:hypothetical protein EVAR_97569_1 [Eumeta japonica]|uniref:Uncharacterized protein n=1 Tax=Eumeta variegata TaxID=151549 RepID=A0A4C1WNB9_EUMVA|nr:hypothetical protein EVAR_97569_1 [Eumeta japonica]